MKPAAKSDREARSQLIKLATDVHHLARLEYKPIELILAESRSKSQLLAGELVGQEIPFTRITAAESAATKYDMTCLVDNVLVRAGLVRPKKSLKTNIGIDRAVSLAIGGRFPDYFNVPQSRRVVTMSGESGMAST